MKTTKNQKMSAEADAVDTRNEGQGLRVVVAGLQRRTERAREWALMNGDKSSTKARKPNQIQRAGA
jgi:hypothetical protein